MTYLDGFYYPMLDNTQDIVYTYSGSDNLRCSINKTETSSTDILKLNQLRVSIWFILKKA